MKPLLGLFEIALLPLDILKDAATLGGTLIEEDKSAVRQRIEKIEEDLLG